MRKNVAQEADVAVAANRPVNLLRQTGYEAQHGSGAAGCTNKPV